MKRLATLLAIAMPITACGSLWPQERMRGRSDVGFLSSYGNLVADYTRPDVLVWHLPNTDFGEYTGVRSGLQTFGAYRPLLADTANWVVDTTNGNYALTIPNTTDFSVQPIPEPSELAMMVAGFGLAGLIARRRRSAR